MGLLYPFYFGQIFDLQGRRFVPRWPYQEESFRKFEIGQAYQKDFNRFQRAFSFQWLNSCSTLIGKCWTGYMYWAEESTMILVIKPQAFLNYTYLGVEQDWLN